MIGAARCAADELFLLPLFVVEIDRISAQCSPVFVSVCLSVSLGVATVSVCLSLATIYPPQSYIGPRSSPGRVWSTKTIVNRADCVGCADIFDDGDDDDN